MRSRQNEIIGTSKNTDESNINNLNNVITAKMVSMQQIIKRTILAVQRYKTLDVFGANELNICLQSLDNNFQTLKYLQNMSEFNEKQIVEQLQDITNELSSLFRTFGTESIEDLLSICFGTDYAKVHFSTPELIKKYDLMKEHVHPIGYKIMSWKPDTKQNDIP